MYMIFAVPQTQEHIVGSQKVMADFGQTDFGQLFYRLWPILGLTDFCQTDFGQFSCFNVLTKFSEPKSQTPKTQTQKPGERGPPHLFWVWPPPPFLAVLVLLWLCLWLLRLLLVWTPLDHPAPNHPMLDPPSVVKSTSPVTENHNKNGYVNYKNFIMTNEDNNHDTKYTINNDMNNHNAHDLCK